MTQYFFRVGDVDAANALVTRFHYSKRPPANIQCVGTWHREGGLFGDYGDAIAACYFCIPPTRWSEPVLELSRLVRAHDVPVSLTGLIAATCKHLAKTREADLLVSFADVTQGHHGGIYQAASWNYGGKRETRMDGVLIDGAFKPGRSCNSIWGTRSPEKLRALMPTRTVEPHYDEGKHIYWRALNRDGRKKADTLGLKSMPYPKPKLAMIA
jgi:hypothetical protein